MVVRELTAALWQPRPNTTCGSRSRGNDGAINLKSIPCYLSLMDAKTLLAEALQLSDEERAALAGELIQSLDREVDADAEGASSTEIRAR